MTMLVASSFRSFKYICIILISSILLFSCRTTRNLVYFDNLADSARLVQEIYNQSQIKIQPSDELSIKVITLDERSNVLFNSGGISSNTASGITGSLNVGGGTTTSGQGYLVDKDGFIDFPLEGKVQVAGLSLEQVRDRLKALVAKTAKEPIVNVRLVNFKITVIGEVGRPGSYNIPSGKVNILEALGIAGDMLEFAQRDNVLVMREKNGIRQVQRLNMNDKNVLDSEFFNLEQNDIVYVQPINKYKVYNSEMAYNTRYLPYITSILSIASLLLVIFKN